jgi:hypothetical protein
MTLTVGFKVMDFKDGTAYVHSVELLDNVHGPLLRHRGSKKERRTANSGGAPHSACDGKPHDFTSHDDHWEMYSIFEILCVTVNSGVPE